MNDFQRAGAFVVQFRASTDFDLGRVAGRVEHIASGVTAYFESTGELFEMLARLWKDVRVEVPSLERLS